jgi:hypothetical protein
MYPLRGHGTCREKRRRVVSILACHAISSSLVGIRPIYFQSIKEAPESWRRFVRRLRLMTSFETPW